MNVKKTPHTWNCYRKDGYTEGGYPDTSQFYVRIEHMQKLENAIRQTLEENLHLADGDVCTLKILKDSIGFE